MAFEKNCYDRHTLEAVMTQVKKIARFIFGCIFYYAKDSVLLERR